jgi:hypothetical protein
MFLQMRPLSEQFLLCKYSSKAASSFLKARIMNTGAKVIPDVSGTLPSDNLQKKSIGKVISKITYFHQ